MSVALSRSASFLKMEIIIDELYEASQSRLLSALSLFTFASTPLPLSLSWKMLLLKEPALNNCLQTIWQSWDEELPSSLFLLVHVEVTAAVRWMLCLP